MVTLTKALERKTLDDVKGKLLIYLFNYSILHFTLFSINKTKLTSKHALINLIIAALYH